MLASAAPVTRCFGRSTNRPVPVGRSFLLRALMQRHPRPWLARHGCPVGRFRYLEVVYPCDMLNDAVSDVAGGKKAPASLYRGFKFALIIR
jgi:hypothetical protein